MLLACSALRSLYIQYGEVHHFKSQPFLSPITTLLARPIGNTGPSGLSHLETLSFDVHLEGTGRIVSPATSDAWAELLRVLTAEDRSRYPAFSRVELHLEVYWSHDLKLGEDEEETARESVRAAMRCLEDAGIEVEIVVRKRYIQIP